MHSEDVQLRKTPRVWALWKLPFQYQRHKLLKMFLDSFDYVYGSEQSNEQAMCLDVGGITRGFESLGRTCRAIAVNPEVRKGGGWDFAVADGRFLPFRERAVDIAFCNSVLEHVIEGREDLAREIRRVTKADYFVAVPHPYTLIETHYLLPLFQFVPESVKRFLLFRLRLRIGWMSKGTYQEIRLPGKSELRDLFPEAQIRVLRVFGIPVYLVAVHVEHDENRPAK